MTIYYVQPKSGGLIKIGYTSKKVELRVSELQTGCPDQLVILGQEEGDERKEADLHKKFSHLRVTGEWFRPSIELMRHVVDISELECLQAKILRAYAISYSNCIYSHCMGSGPKDLVSLLFNHAQYVSVNNVECWNFLKDRGVDSVCWKKCQYFFSICWPIHEPWMDLNRHVVSQMLKSGDIKQEWLPTNPYANQRLFTALEATTA